MGLFGGNQMPVDGKTVLITGASEGMGLSVSKMLAAKGANLVLVSRSVDKLEAALRQVQASAKHPDSQRFHYVPADVGAPGYAVPLLEEATRWNRGRSPDVVWTIAGFARPRLFTDMDLASHRHQMDVNYFGTAELCHAVLRDWLAPGRPVEPQPRRFVMTSSVAAFYTLPGYAPYTPSKCALRGLADTLSREVLLYPQNVKVHAVYPGTILSPGIVQENAKKPEITKILEETDPKQEPDAVAAAAIAGLERGDHFVSVNLLGTLMRCGAIAGSLRNNWVMDTLLAWLAQPVYFFTELDFHGKIKDYAKKHGHPSAVKEGSA